MSRRPSEPRRTMAKPPSLRALQNVLQPDEVFLDFVAAELHDVQELASKARVIVSRHARRLIHGRRLGTGSDPLPDGANVFDEKGAPTTSFSSR